MRPESALMKPSGAIASVSAGKVGRPPRARLTLATVPLARNVTNAQSESRIELSGIDEFEKSALGIYTRDDGFDGDFLAIGENQSGDGAVFYANVLDFGIGANFCAGFTGGVGESVGERAESSARKCSGTGWIGIDSGAEKKDRGGTGRPRPERGAENSASGDDGAEQFSFKKFGHEIRDGHRAPAEQVENAALAKAANVAASLEEMPEIFGRRRVDGGRRDGTQLREEAGDFFQRSGELRVFCGVFCGETRDAAGGLGDIVIEKQRLAVGARSEDARIGAKNFAIEFFQLKIASNVSAKWPDRVR